MDDVAAIDPAQLFAANESWLRTVVRSRIPETHGVDDVMQNIALAIVKQADALDEINKLGAWLYQVAVRQVLMYRRTLGRRRRLHDMLPDAVLDQADHQHQFSPVDQVLAAEDGNNVRWALARLDELDRQVMMLKYMEGWTYQQMAQQLGVSINTIEYRLQKSRDHLRHLLSARMQAESP